MAKIVLKSERGRFRYYLNDDAGNEVFFGPYIIQKDLAETYIQNIITIDDLTNHIQSISGPDGKWVFRVSLHATREGEKGLISDAIPMGFSPKFATQAEADKAAKAFVKVAKGAEFVDES